MSEPKQHRTLFAIDARDRRARKQLLGGRSRNETKHQPSSDVTRLLPIMMAAVLAVVGVVAAWVLLPSADAVGGGGQLALPHREAGLVCATCHSEGEQPAQACVGCHGKHKSARAGHRKLMANGSMGCVSCHQVHTSDQGIRWLPAKDGPSTTLRYWVGRHAQVEPGTLQVERPITVPLIPLARCKTCHSLDNQRDPLWRCVMNRNVKSDETAFSGCFDEHRSATDISPRAGKVCSQQHGGQRFAAWDAARLTVEQPSTSVASATGQPRPWVWLLTGLVCAAIGGFGARGWLRVKSRRRVAATTTKVTVADRVRLPQINTNTCLGCYACVDACPYDVLEIERYVARVARPEACCGLTLCEQVCPNGSLVITDGEPIGDRPLLNEHLQAQDAPGLYLAGDITGLPLIKNAIAQGNQAIDAIADNLAKHPHPLDVIIVGAGPAGISAALRAKERKLRYLVIEQGSVAQSIRSFPRGKLVFAQPLKLPVVGKLWLEESSKEELLTKWLRIVRREQLRIDEHTRFVSSQPQPQGFELVAETLETSATDADDGRGQAAATRRLDAAHVLLCIGQRGTPRKLDLALAASAESKVFYHLADAHSFAEQRVLVVGLGDVAMETAIAIARQPGTEVTVAHRGAGFSRGKARNVNELKRLSDMGRVRLLWHAKVVSVGDTQVQLDVKGERVALENDTVFVMIGSLPPSALLRQAGVRMSEGG